MVGTRFSSTQATVLSLRAIIAYEEARAAAMTDVTMDVNLDGTKIGSLAAAPGDEVWIGGREVAHSPLHG